MCMCVCIFIHTCIYYIYKYIHAYEAIFCYYCINTSSNGGAFCTHKLMFTFLYINNVQQIKLKIFLAIIILIY